MDYRTRQAYIDAGFGERFTTNQPDADYINDKLFEEECLPNTAKVRLENILRIDRGAKGEWIKYNYTLVGKTQFGQERQRPKTEGMWLRPIFSISVDEKTGQHQIIDKIDRNEEVWTIPYSPENVKKILAFDEFSSNVGLTIEKFGRQYAITDIDRFINEPFDKLYPKIDIV
jgi:hypothetical protein